MSLNESVTSLRPYKSLPISVLQPYERNARTHSEAQIEQLRASIREFGFTNPVLVDEAGRILAGHGRVLAAAAEGMSHVPTLEVAGLSDAQRRALILADNRLALDAGWDANLLAEELRGLQLDGYDLDVIGFSTQELHDLLHVEPSTGGEDEAPPVPANPVCVLGDVWILGPHRLVVGDACTQGAYEALLGTERVDCVWTDPPYNVAYQATAGSIQNDDQSDGDFRQFLLDAFTMTHAVLKPGGAIYVAHADAGATGVSFREAFLASGLKLAACLIWKKDSLVLGGSDYQRIHEPILYGWKPGSRHRWFGGRKNTSVVDLNGQSPFEQQADGRWVCRIGNKLLVVSGDAAIEELVPSLVEEPRPKRSTEHPTMKPVALVERLLAHSARAGDLVLDPFGGSGSTLIAADRLGMSARLIEIDPAYADVVVTRWQGYTGRQAVHADGRIFDATRGSP